MWHAGYTGFARYAGYAGYIGDGQHHHAVSLVVDDSLVACVLARADIIHGHE